MRNAAIAKAPARRNLLFRNRLLEAAKRRTLCEARDGMRARKRQGGPAAEPPGQYRAHCEPMVAVKV